MYIGITGYIGGGKDEVSNIFVSKGFGHLSLSDIIRDLMIKEGVKINRDNLVCFANDLRKKYGPNFLAVKTVQKIKEFGHNNVVITSIRNPFEIEELSKLTDFHMVNVSAPLKLRFERLVKRGRENVTTDFKTFLKEDKRERKGDKHKQQIMKCIQACEFTVINDSTLEELKNKVERLIQDIKIKYKRPSWDEYFMEIVRTVSKRSTCNRGRTAVIIVKNKRILSTGYVGSPPGQPHCDEVGHLYESRYDKDGKESKHCIRTTHGEANAIAQAAKYGISIDGATIYCKLVPCWDCAKLCVASGIKRIVCEFDYHKGELTKDLFKKAGVKLEILNDVNIEYLDKK